MGGLPIVGDPDFVAKQLADLSQAGLTGIGVSLVNYADELPFFCAECCRGSTRIRMRRRSPGRPMTARVGIIIPSSNRMVEEEMVQAFPAGVQPHVTRLRMTGPNRAPLATVLPRTWRRPAR